MWELSSVWIVGSNFLREWNIEVSGAPDADGYLVGSWCVKLLTAKNQTSRLNLVAQDSVWEILGFQEIAFLPICHECERRPQASAALAKFTQKGGTWRLRPEQPLLFFSKMVGGIGPGGPLQKSNMVGGHPGLRPIEPIFGGGRRQGAVKASNTGRRWPVTAVSNEWTKTQTRHPYCGVITDVSQGSDLFLALHKKGSLLWTVCIGLQIAAVCWENIENCIYARLCACVCVCVCVVFMFWVGKVWESEEGTPVVQIR